MDGIRARAIYEQFAGYFDLEPLMAAEVAPPPVPADLMLGPERVARSQLVKQADVLMLHHLIPDEVVPGSLAPCLDFYEPRTVHGSSLSPAIHASLLARAGEPDQALALLRLAARIDLDDLTGTTSGGLHLAAMGGLWQALAWGFLGLRARGGVLWIDPRLPSAWNALALRFRVFGNPVTVRAEPGGVTVACAVPMRVRIADRAPVRCEPPGATFTVRPAETKGQPSKTVITTVDGATSSTGGLRFVRLTLGELIPKGKTAPMWIDHRGSEVLAMAECLRLVATEAANRGVGRLAVSGDQAPIVVPVNFSFADHQVLVCMGEGSLWHRAEGHLIAFEVDQATVSGGQAWSVLIWGSATELSDPLDVGIRRSPHPLVPDAGSKVLAIRPDVAQPGDDSLSRE